MAPQRGLFIFPHMQQKYLPWFLLFCAIGLSTTAAYYSVIGLSVVFTGVAIPVIIMGSFLEVSKIAIATYLHNAWKKTYTLLKVYLTLALITLSLITSIGIYGLLSTGFQENIAKLEIQTKQTQNIKVKKQRFEEIKLELTQEKTTLDKDISQLRNALSTNTTTQSVDNKTGQIITKSNKSNLKAFETQLTTAQSRRDEIANKISTINDSITNLDIQVLDMESQASQSNELGAVQYVSEITGYDLKTVANWFIFMLIFVFDPLAITLVIATNQAFNQRKPKQSGIVMGTNQDAGYRLYIKPNHPVEETHPTNLQQVGAEYKLDTTEDTPVKETQPTNLQQVEQEKQSILNEIQKIQNAGISHRKTAVAIDQLQNQLKNLEDNTKTY